MDERVYRYLPGFAPQGTYDRLLEEIRDKVSSKRFTMYGRVCEERRPTAFFSTTPVRMRYIADSDGGSSPMPRGSVLEEMLAFANGKELRDQISDLPEFNSVFVNYYRNGDDYISPHSDNLKDQVTSHVLSISVNPPGGERPFQIFDRDSSSMVEEFLLGDGDVFLMYGDCQSRYKHGVPRRRKIKEGRINLTFRCCREKISS